MTEATDTSTETPVVTASRASWRCVQAGDRETDAPAAADDHRAAAGKRTANRSLPGRTSSRPCSSSHAGW
ncbi:hypothetical protein PXH80_33845, partial [Mycolicibacterium smegmatis]|nr:hypothetical protein [Mycolicibacterium smegmatis]